MWKLILAFLLFAAAAIYVISKGGDSLDMGGEKHGSEAVEHSPAAASAALPTSASAPAVAPSAAVSAASAASN